MKKEFENTYPYLTLYLCHHGWIAIGEDHHYTSWLRIFDVGGLRLEVDEDFLDDSLKKGELWAKEWMTDNYEEAVKEMLKNENK